MHRLTGGSWKRSTRPTTATEKNYPMGKPHGSNGSSAYSRPQPPHQLSTLQPDLIWFESHRYGFGRWAAGIAADLPQDLPRLELGVGAFSWAARAGVGGLDFVPVSK